MQDGIRYKYEVKDEDGPLRYSMELSRHDYLRVAKAMLEDWKNDTCVGKYLKTIHERRIPKPGKIIIIKLKQLITMEDLMVDNSILILGGLKIEIFSL